MEFASLLSASDFYITSSTALLALEAADTIEVSYFLLSSVLVVAVSF